MQTGKKDNQGGAKKLLKSLDNFCSEIASDVDKFAKGGGNYSLLKEGPEYELIMKLIDRSDKIRKLASDTEAEPTPDDEPKIRNLQDFALNGKKI